MLSWIYFDVHNKSLTDCIICAFHGGIGGQLFPEFDCYARYDLLIIIISSRSYVFQFTDVP